MLKQLGSVKIVYMKKKLTNTKFFSTFHLPVNEFGRISLNKYHTNQLHKIK